MSIYYDPTESRSGSRLPDSVISAGVELPGLEQYTGADILISPLSDPKMTVVSDSMPSQKMLRMHTAVGLLVQRKSGMDALGSIPDYSNILVKMLSWCETVPPWLVVVGDYKQGKDDCIMVEGRVVQWRYNAFQGALENWQIHGGGISWLLRDSQLGPWVARWHDKVGALAKQPELVVSNKKPSQVLVASPDDKAWVTTLATFPDIGLELANRIGAYCGTLADSLTFLSNPAHLKLKKGNTSFPKGIGKSIFVSSHRWLGLRDDDEVCEILCKDDDGDIDDESDPALSGDK
jgi:hypothetical protein